MWVPTKSITLPSDHAFSNNIEQRIAITLDYLFKDYYYYVSISINFLVTSLFINIHCIYSFLS